MRRPDDHEIRNWGIALAVPLLIALLITGCANMNNGLGFLSQDCSKVGDPIAFSQAFACPVIVEGLGAEDPARHTALCEHSWRASYHTMMAVCIGVTDEGPALTSEEE